jgi:hypothetical protein
MDWLLFLKSLVKSQEIQWDCYWAYKEHHNQSDLIVQMKVPCSAKRSQFSPLYIDATLSHFERKSEWEVMKGKEEKKVYKKKEK